MKNKYEVRGDITVIYVDGTHGLRECLIDTTMLSVLLSYKTSFRYRSYGKSNQRCYVITTNRLAIRIHRLLTRAADGMVVDHINHNTLDNRLENLRVITHAENLQNTRKISSDNNSGIRGLFYNKINVKWVANIRSKCFYFRNQSDAIRFLEIARAIEMPYSQEAMNIITDDDRKFYEEVKRRESTSKKRGSRLTGGKGVHFNSREGLWIARVRYKNKNLYEKRFRTEDEALDAIREVRQKIREQLNITG